MKKLIALIFMSTLFGFHALAEVTNNDDGADEPVHAAGAIRPAAAGNSLSITVDQSSQTMVVSGPGGFHATWSVSTGIKSKGLTPNGTFHAGALGDHRTIRLYHGKHVILRHAIELVGAPGIYIHVGGHLGTKSSNGCIHLSEKNAATLLALARRVGGGKHVTITVHN